MRGCYPGGPPVMPDEPRVGSAVADEMGDGRRTIPPVSTPSRGRPRAHGYRTMRRALTALTTRRLDGRSAIAVALRRWKEDVRHDLGGDLSRAQETTLEAAAQAWVILASLDDWIA